ncbi:MAG TPA: ATP-dependent DNA helicase UvrD2 [Nocardioidaceae bacterium]|nr:ATP-dependent DNA helicase UvrD2 [Nocardioidaceae bacterium]
MAEADRLLEALDPEQREVATCLRGPVRVLAGAGTGKTRAITHRIAYGVATGEVAAGEILAVTFTTRAAGELRQRLASLGAVGVQARTFHSAALRQARYFWPQVFGGELPSIAGSKIPLVAEAVGRNRLKGGPADLRDLAGEIEWAKVSNVRAGDYPAVAPAAGRTVDGYDAATVAHVYATYEEVKRSRNRIDMEDVLLCAAAVLADDERVAAAVRRQYGWFVVDEFQDVNPLQSTLLDLWLGGRDELCVVGDPAQTIYSFAGATADHLHDFPRKFEGTTTLTLARNYRSTPQVVSTANSVMAGQLGDRAVALKAVRDSGSAVAFTGFADEVAEAAGVATAIAAAIAQGTPAAGIAVLFRINAQSEAFEEALAERGVPFVVRGAERFFDRPEVKQAIALLRGATRGAEPRTGGLVGDVNDVLSSMGWSSEAPVGRGAARDRWESLNALVSMGIDLADDHPDATLEDFVAELRRRAEVQHAPVADGVTLATLHTAKGLEWPVVHLVGMHEGMMPIVHADTPAAVEEERRLLYVGVTRARDRLQVSWSMARNPGGRGSRSPSRFLDALLDPSQKQAEPGSRASRGRRAKAGLAHCRVCNRSLTDARERKLGRCLDCPSSYDESLFDSLREWRREQAALAKVPAYCIFTDATLTALAEMQPSDLAALVRVPGIGRSKADKYGADIVQLCTSATASTRAPQHQKLAEKSIH